MKKILLSPDSAAGGAAKPSTPEDLSKLTKDELIARLNSANARLAEFEAKAAQFAADEKVIAEKISVGLPRQQAIAVIQRQREHDAREHTQSKP